MDKRKIISIVLSVLFISFAVLQYNDPDPWAWIIMYGVVGLVPGSAAIGKYSKWFNYAVMAISIVWMIILFPGLWQWITEEPADALLYGMSDDKMYIEESREFLGLAMGMAALLYTHRAYGK